MEKDLNYFKKNAEEDYMKVPISVLRYITELENGNFAKPMLANVAVELTEPNHLDYKVKNKYDEWV